MKKQKTSTNALQLEKLPTAPVFSELEEMVLEYWQANNTFQQSVENRTKDKQYVFYDGPPFATGMPHYGHLLGSTSKDVIARYWTMKGFRVERVWGWDCHGLPIENMIEQKLGITQGKREIEERGIDTFNEACRAEVLRLDAEWEKIITRLGRWVDFKHSYKTMDASYMESVWWGFSQLDKKGLIYQGKKVILYCSRCATPLSNFEIAMDNSYDTITDAATTYKYQISGTKDTYILAWSTTPWNKIVTPALAVHPDLEYVQVKQGDEHYILAQTTLAMLGTEPYTIEKSMTGKELTKLTFEPHFDFFPDRTAQERFGVIVADEFVTAEEGTGVVTLAVYGEDDFRVMQREHIQLSEHVDEEGKIIAAVKPWAGLSIAEVNPLVNEALAKRNLIYQDLPHTHSVAVCYRCSTRLYYAPVPAWFIDVQKLRPALLRENEKMNWYPEYLKEGRFAKGIENAPDWNISRSRYWATPIPVWQASTGERRVIQSIADLQKWAVHPEEVADVYDLHRHFVDDIEVWIDDDKTIKGKRIPEVFDCWVESGSMPYASRHYPFENKQVFEETYPAQFVSEYIAQTRGWFYTMHVMSVGIFDQQAVENTLTTGTILAADGSKMSKSKKNFPDPMAVIDRFGVDSLRLYLMSSPVMKGENINFNEKEVSDIRKRIFLIWWNVLSFHRLFANAGEHPTAAPHADATMDRWILSRTHSLIKDVTKEFDSYEVVRASRRLMEFVTELSTWYLRQSRDRFKNSETQPQASAVLSYVLVCFAQLFSPVTPFFSELQYQNLVGSGNSVHLTDWPTFESKLIDETLETGMTLVQKICEKGHALRKESGIKVRQPLAAVIVTSTAPKLSADLLEILMQELNVKAVEWKNGSEELEVSLETKLTDELKAEGEARELMRTIQGLRKEAGLTLTDTAIVSIPSWPKAWQTAIEERTNTQLQQSEQIQIQKIES